MWQIDDGQLLVITVCFLKDSVRVGMAMLLSSVIVLVASASRPIGGLGLEGCGLGYCLGHCSRNVYNKAKNRKKSLFWNLKKNVKNVKVMTCKVLETTQSVFVL